MSSFKCTRCLQMISSSNPGKCYIAHPNHLREDGGSMYGGGKIRHDYTCGGCSKCYSTGCDMPDNLSDIDPEGMPVIEGPKWCYEGPHTAEPLPETDLRRNYGDSVVVITGNMIEMQTKLNALNGNSEVKVLKVLASVYDSDQTITLDVSLPNLEELILEDVNMGRLVLNPTLTPNVRKIQMQNPNEDGNPDFTIICPQLEEFTIYYWGPGHHKWLQDMLDAATNLKKFDSYKLRVGYLKFASNHLESIRLHRAELLRRIDLWAPRLVDLNVQAAYDLYEVHFIDTHELQQDLPEDFQFRDELHVNSENAILGGQALDAIVAHPRFHGTRESLKTDDDYW